MQLDKFAFSCLKFGLTASRPSNANWFNARSTAKLLQKHFSTCNTLQCQRVEMDPSYKKIRAKLEVSKHEYPQLKDFNNETVVKYLEYMTSFGFQISKANEMIIKYPPVLDNYKEWLVESLKAFQALGFSDRQQKKLLARYPQLLTFPRRAVIGRADFLKSYFTSDELLQLIENNLSVICEHTNIVQKKLEYLLKGASHTSESISKSSAVSRPLSFIMTRHEFLIRAGLYEVIPYQKFFKVMEKINQKVSTAPGGKKFREKYFLPNEVVCLGDEYFIKVCTNNTLTINELAAFEEIHAKELENSPDETDYDSHDWTESEIQDEIDKGIEMTAVLRTSCGYFTELENKDFYY